MCTTPHRPPLQNERTKEANPNDSQRIYQRLAALEARAQSSEVRLADAEHHIQTGRRKLRVTWAVSALAALVALAIGWHKDAIAQGYGMTLAQAATRIAALETKTASMSEITDANTNKPTVRFEGVNVQISGGYGNTVSNVQASISGGYGNRAIGRYSSVSGSSDNTAGSMITGLSNTTFGNYFTISGGSSRYTNDDYQWVDGSYTSAQ